jgi:agmatinase
MAQEFKTFGGTDIKYADAKTANILLQSIPYDGTSTWGKGADRGFAAFMEAAENMELYDIETDSEVYQEGIHVLPELTGFTSPEEMYREVYQRTKQLLEQQKFLTFFGGEHSISIGVIDAYCDAYPDITILQIDAHADLRPAYDGSEFNHACALYRASKRANLLQVGIRSMDITEKPHMNVDQVYFAHDIWEVSDWMSRAIGQMTDQVYITFDLDALDPSIMPSTGTPEPGGLDWYTTIEFLRRVFEGKEVVGFDIVELAPIENLRAPQFLAAKLYYKMLSYKFHNRSEQTT